MVVVRRRLIFWLIKAYIKKSKKTILFSFLAGLLIFFGIIFGGKYLTAILTFQRQPVIGVVGSYERDNLPSIIENKLSGGLTKVEENGEITKNLSSDYTIENKGKTYTFILKNDQRFNDGSKFESKDLFYNFSDVKIERPEKNKIIFKLKDSYAPFLVTISQPVFKKGYVGVGDFYIKDIKLNGNFVQNLTLGSKNKRFEKTRFIFYPTENALKTAFALGEITQASGVLSIDFQNISFEKFPKTTIKKDINYSSLVTLFYNTTDPTLSDRKVRLALNYALPSNDKLGKSAYLPYAPTSIYFNKEVAERKQDFDHAKLLLLDSKPQLTISTLKKYSNIAKIVESEWKKVGIATKIEEVDQVPDRYQIFLGDFNVPKDPDQYALWHTGQNSNITRYKNLRIDKLLEDGRKTIDINERKRIYADFQRFLIEDMPASFFYFPYEYTITRN
ncbi:MAG TPA: ABC transporter substrate-binding protein [Candidatus Limnocylindrales bacterium]|nr:ABC transporter substrate-binding protein [Candidatus Limnocylindrales bacterium]